MKRFLAMALTLILATAGTACVTELPSALIEQEQEQEQTIYDTFEEPIILGEGTEWPLNGIMTMPINAAESVPAVVLVHGSGPNDMDETLYENKPFRDIADYLASHGIAVIRYDKRTFAHGMKFIDTDPATITAENETVEDAILAANMLKADPRIDASRVYILGHSMGGMLAPRIHAEGGDFAGIMMMAGTPRSMLEVMVEQLTVIVDELPEGEEKAAVAAITDFHKKAYEDMQTMSDEETKAYPMDGNMTLYYYKEMVNNPPADYIKDITVPFFVFQGAEDFQVYADKDFEAYKEIFADNPNATLKLYDGLNHIMMKSTTGDASEYMTPDHVDGQVLADIAEWIFAN